MRIVLRTSGGRGEYEIAGSQAGISVGHLFDKQFVVEVTPDVRIITSVFLKHIDGKSRMRLSDDEKGKRDRHIYSLLAAICLLPKPIRELGNTGFGKLQLVEGKFSIIEIPFDLVEITGRYVVIRPTVLLLANNDKSEALDVVQRMQLVYKVWEAANSARITSKFSQLLREHYEAYTNQSFSTLIEVAEKIRHLTESDEDPLRQITRLFGLSSIETYDMGITTDFQIQIEEDNPLTIETAKQEIIRKWRYVAIRGSAGERFKKEVREAYNNTCLFTGFYLPKTDLTNTPGVDAAHILPWAIHGLNGIQNGICLSKLCHWAFDQGVLNLSFDKRNNEYLITIPEAFKKLGSKFDLTAFTSIEGIIPKNRLPDNQNLWPEPKFIEMFNTQIQSGTSF